MESNSLQSQDESSPAFERLPLTERYRYTPLNEEIGEIRLLSLLPGQFFSKIRIIFDTIVLLEEDSDGEDTNEEVTPYEALSYTWGSHKNLRNIFIGRSDFSFLPVTKNLAEALTYLRYEDQPRKLWIDAICVNQQDPNERGCQVSRMADIYSKATKVVAWLGAESSDSAVAIHCINEISSHVRADWGTRTLDQVTACDDEWADEGNALPFDVFEISAMYNLISRSWFERLWIWQEIRLGSEHSVIMCGTSTTLWDSVRTAVFCLRSKPHDHNQFTRSIFQETRIDMVYNLCDVQSAARLGGIMEYTKHSLCSDPRDKIFAVLSIRRDYERYNIPIKPDYTKSAFEIYKDVCLKYVQVTRNLSILTTAELRLDAERKPPSSWVPHWCVGSATNQLRNCSASGHSQAITENFENDMLRVTGISVAVVERAIAFNLPNSASIEQWHNELFQVIASLELEHLSNDDTKLLYKVLCSMDFAELYYPPATHFLGMQEAKDTLDSLLHDPLNRIYSIEERRFLGTVSSSCAHRSLVLTTDKRFAIAPKSTKAGDIVTVLLGCDPCMVLRSSLDNQYKVVGEAFCDGFMEGQAVMGGSLPDNLHLVMRYNEKAYSYFKAYLNRETGSLYPERPGLGFLPLGWSRKSHRNEEFETVFENVSTGETTLFDPRFLPEHLKARGIDVRAFDLI